MTRQGTKVYTLFILGLSSDDHSILTKLVLPDIKNLNNFKLKKIKLSLEIKTPNRTNH